MNYELHVYCCVAFVRNAISMQHSAHAYMHYSFSACMPQPKYTDLRCKNALDWYTSGGGDAPFISLAHLYLTVGACCYCEIEALKR
jgi:hypothetical protein